MSQIPFNLHNRSKLPDNPLTGTWHSTPSPTCPISSHGFVSASQHYWRDDDGQTPFTQPISSPITPHVDRQPHLLHSSSLNQNAGFPISPSSTLRPPHASISCMNTRIDCLGPKHSINTEDEHGQPSFAAPSRSSPVLNVRLVEYTQSDPTIRRARDCRQHSTSDGISTGAISDTDGVDDRMVYANYESDATVVHSACDHPCEAAQPNFPVMRNAVSRNVLDTPPLGGVALRSLSHIWRNWDD